MKDLLDDLHLNPLGFDELVSLGRSIIPTIAPEWTDHNVHDPGIMLVELMAWIAEAQMYSLSRIRRDERRAYARLLGVEPRGPRPALGLVWPLAGDDTTAARPAWTEGFSLKVGTAALSERLDAPKFSTIHEVALTTARIVRIETRLADGGRRDWTSSNSRDGATFLPFGEAAASSDRLVVTLEMKAGDLAAFTGPLSLGFEIVNDGTRPDRAIGRRRDRLAVSLEDADGARPVSIAADTTGGLLTSGVVILTIVAPPASEPAPNADALIRFAIVIRSATEGFLRPPRVRRIGVNVLAITQAASITDETAALLGGLPNQTYALQQPGLMFPFTQGSFTLEVSEDGAFQTWTEQDLDLSGPQDRHYELDPERGIVSFGNGINGHIPEQEFMVRVNYRVSAGTRGNLPKGLRWTIFGVGGDFGVNGEAMSAGSDAQGLRELRGLARAHSQKSRPLVTTGDLEEAALSFKDLGITRAHEVTATDTYPAVRGSRILAIVGLHDPTAAEVVAAEGDDLLEEVNSRLAPRLPLGQRLEVIAPRYVPLRISATLRAARNVSPKDVEGAARKKLREELALVTTDGQNEWPLGRDVTQIAVKGWLRRVEGVARVISVQLRVGDNGDIQARMTVGPRDLPQYQFEAGDLTVEPSPIGSAT